MAQSQRGSYFFAKQFELQSDLLVHALGRFSLFGEHTNYNDGFVLPSTIDCAKTGAGVVA